MQFIIDSCVLLDYPLIIEDKDKEIVITLDVLKELDGLKKHTNPEIAFKARRAAVYISRNMDKINFHENTFNKPTDDKLIDAAKELGATLITNDVYLKVKATLANVMTKGYSQKDSYSGVFYWYPEFTETFANEQLENIYEKGEIPEALVNEQFYENQYVIIKNKEIAVEDKNGEIDYEDIGAFVVKDGKLKGVGRQKISNMYIDKIFPKNIEQTCLFHALNNKDNTIIYAGGSYGRGKSFILNNYALQELEQGSINKIVYVPNNAFTENTMDIGALPGGLFEKIEGQIGPLIDLIGIDAVQRLISQEQLEIVPMGFIRGRSFTNSIIIVNESQNLTEDHLKLLIGRCGDNSRIFFDGDIKQADSQLFRDKNGLKLLLNLRKSPIYSKMFATVKLTKTERSQTAQAASYLDQVIPE